MLRAPTDGIRKRKDGRSLDEQILATVGRLTNVWGATGRSEIEPGILPSASQISPVDTAVGLAGDDGRYRSQSAVHILHQCVVVRLPVVQEAGFCGYRMYCHGRRRGGCSNAPIT